jgi:hypothetical protein
MVDVEALTLTYLRGLPDLSGVTVGTTRPADLSARLPFVLVTRVGGGAAGVSWRGGPVLDQAGINVQGWASPDRAAARHLIHQVIGALTAARAVALPEGVIVRVRVLAGPTALPDAAAPDHVHRFTATVQATAR